MMNTRITYLKQWINQSIGENIIYQEDQKVLSHILIMLVGIEETKLNWTVLKFGNRPVCLTVVE